MDWAPVQVAAVLFLATVIRLAFDLGEALEVPAPVAVLVSITIAAIMIAQDWRDVHLGSAMVSMLFGIPVGVLVLKTVPEAGRQGRSRGVDRLWRCRRRCAGYREVEVVFITAARAST
jgi:hypothetical protein